MIRLALPRLLASKWLWTGVGILIAILLGQSIRVWGVWPAAFAVGIVLSAFFGWNRAYRFWTKNGYVRKL